MKRVLSALAFIAVVAGCGAGVTYNHDWDRNTDFSQYTSYSWMPQSKAPAASNDMNAQRASSDLVDKRIRNAVDTQLQAKGLKKVDSGGDLGVLYHIGLQDKVQVEDWGYSYSPYYYGFADRDISVYNYKEGTLILDMIDANKSELVWRGSATGVVDENPSPEEMEAKLNDVMMGMLQDYPPAPGTSAQ